MENLQHKTLHYNDNVSPPHNLIAIFKVRFHVHRGNELVWQYPLDLDLQGIEYQMICSGLHLVENDTIYFSRWNGFGVGVFEKQAIDHDRGASMQAVGVLVSGRPDLEDDTSLLEEYYKTHHLTLTSPVLERQHAVNARYLRPFDSVTCALTYYIESTTAATSTQQDQDPFSSFRTMVMTLGPAVFVLWKAILAKQRILLMKPAPPMEKLCHFVYHGYLMDQWDHDNNSKTPVAPKFNIGINDIEDLEKEMDHSYIACTSDTIFDIKKDLYDVLIKLPMDASPPTIITQHLQINTADMDRYQLLLQQQQQQKSQQDIAWYPYYRYKGLLWWDRQMSSLDMGLEACFSSCRRRGWTKYQHQHQQHYDGSIHALDETMGLLDDATDDEDDGDDEGLLRPDAEELDSRTILDPTRRLSHDVPDSLNASLLGFFHVLSSQLISSLQTMLPDDHDDVDEQVTLTVHDMLRLGLEPWEDRWLVDRLGQLYFGKRIKVVSCSGRLPCCSPSLQL
ncbi:hypothetical protein [Absidia glauca]|uniref:UDENN domain-containing protein n=1 Tax=Absidia glauca TaxID=4829 RepID=A0A168PQB6_ABSGL|nr:hypothetical protein [Absidia glauca]